MRGCRDKEIVGLWFREEPLALRVVTLPYIFVRAVQISSQYKMSLLN